MKAKLRKTHPKEQKNKIGIESYGVRIGFELGEEIHWSKIKKRLKLMLPNGFDEFRRSEELDNLKFNFQITKNSDASYNIAESGAEIIGRVPEDLMLEQLERSVRMSVAEFAVDKVFLHAGVVGWNGRAIVIPAKSFQGKTTLVAELVKKGAIYYSDEYAVIDENGMVHPFPKMLSMRGIVDAYQQIDMPVESFGGVAGSDAIPVGLVLITQFKANARWLPKILSPGNAMMEIIAHTLPIRNKPEFTLKVLNNMINRAIITKTKRGDAAQVASLIIGFFEEQTLKS